MSRFIPIKIRIKAHGSPKWSKNLAHLEVQAGEDFTVDLTRYLTGDAPFTITKNEGPDWAVLSGTILTGTAPDTADMFTITLTAANPKGDDMTTFKISVCVYLVPYTYTYQPYTYQPYTYQPYTYRPGPYTYKPGPYTYAPCP